MTREVTVNREDFYLLTGKSLTNSSKVLEYAGSIERLYNFGNEPTKEEVLHFVNLIRQYNKSSDNYIKELREFGTIKQ